MIRPFEATNRHRYSKLASMYISKYGVPGMATLSWFVIVDSRRACVSRDPPSQGLDIGSDGVRSGCHHARTSCRRGRRQLDTSHRRPGVSPASALLRRIELGSEVAPR